MIKYDGYKLKYYRHNVTDSTSIANNFVFYLTGDSEGNIWIGFVKDGLDCLNPNTETFIHYPYKVEKRLLEIQVNFIYIDTDQQLWVSTESGLLKLDKQSRTFRLYTQAWLF